MALSSVFCRIPSISSRKARFRSLIVSRRDGNCIMALTVFCLLELVNLELNDFGVRPWFVTSSMSPCSRVIYRSSVSTNSHILNRRDSSFSTETPFDWTVVGAFFRVVGVEFEGVLLFDELGTRLEGVACPLCGPSEGRKEGLVFLIDARGLTGVGGLAGRSLENGLRASMTSSTLVTFIMRQVTCAACVWPHFSPTPSLRFSSVMAFLTSAGTSEKYLQSANAMALDTSSR